MNRSHLLTVALAASALGGTANAASGQTMTIMPSPGSWDIPRFIPLRPSTGFGGVPRYNQRKARKLARQTGNHPANRKRA